MGEQQGGGRGSTPAEELILRTVAAHADSLLRTARRHSICADDAQDAYQRALEIFMTHAERLEPERAAGWLHVVVKREAQAIRRSRKDLVSSSDVDYDTHASRRLPTPDEQLLSFDLVSRSAEALQRLKPQELRALWLKAQGHSYNDIGAITGWSYTKVNRCLTEGRRNFLERYAGIESGAECERWMPVISAMVDGEATPEQILELRPHLRNCPGCRATLKALHGSSAPLTAVLPVPLVVVAGGGGEHVTNVFMRAYEAVAGGFHERAIHSATKMQAALEAAAGGKVAAVAASAAAVAGGGYATVERTVSHERHDQPAKIAGKHESKRPNESAALARRSSTSPIRSQSSRTRSGAPAVNEFGQPHRAARSATPTEFGTPHHNETVRVISAAAGKAPPQAQAPVASKPKAVAPEFGSTGATNEFGP
jgi:RNA polymerase sigma factor (sigma-70 family)